MKYKRYKVIDEDGNENCLLVGNNESIEVVNHKELNPKQIEYLKRTNEVRSLTNMLGGYIHMYYINNELLFNKLNIDRVNICRLIYLATYIDYNDREENVLVRHGVNNKIEYLTKKDMKNILKISDATFSRFMTDVIENDLLFNANDKYYISNEYFSKGKNLSKDNYTRVFADTIKSLYESTSTRQHKQLSYVFQLVPFLEYNTNIISYSDKHLSLKEVCKLLNISTNKCP